MAGFPYRPAEQARVFGRVADVYGRTRPGYPAAAVPWLVGTGRRRVLDLGAGTGKLTVALISAGHDVVAVDPAAPMLEVLRAAMPGIDARTGRAEAIPLPDADVDVVVVAQAFHWFEPGAALPEIARVTRPGGRLALVWNLRDASVPWMAELSQLIGSDDSPPVDVVRPRFGAPEYYGELEETTFAQSQLLDREGLLGLVESRSYVAVRPPAEQAEILSEVARLYYRYAGAAGLWLPYTTNCYRAQRSAVSFRPGKAGSGKDRQPPQVPGGTPCPAPCPGRRSRSSPPTVSSNAKLVEEMAEGVHAKQRVAER